MIKLVLKKRFHVIKTYDDFYDFADDVETLKQYFTEGLIEQLQRNIRQRCFGLTLTSTKMRFGNGLVLQAKLI